MIPWSPFRLIYAVFLFKDSFSTTLQDKGEQGFGDPSSHQIGLEGCLVHRHTPPCFSHDFTDMAFETQVLKYRGISDSVILTKCKDRQLSPREYSVVPIVAFPPIVHDQHLALCTLKG